jgi:hypothetical protein
VAAGKAGARGAQGGLVGPWRGISSGGGSGSRSGISNGRRAGAVRRVGRLSRIWRGRVRLVSLSGGSVNDRRGASLGGSGAGYRGSGTVDKALIALLVFAVVWSALWIPLWWWLAAGRARREEEQVRGRVIRARLEAISSNRIRQLYELEAGAGNSNTAQTACKPAAAAAADGVTIAARPGSCNRLLLLDGGYCSLKPGHLGPCWGNPWDQPFRVPVDPIVLNVAPGVAYRGAASREAAALIHADAALLAAAGPREVDPVLEAPAACSEAGGGGGSGGGGTLPEN